MKQVEFQRLLDDLRKAIKVASDTDDFDRMSTVFNALKTWRSTVRDDNMPEEELPFADWLQEWGLWLPTEVRDKQQVGIKDEGSETPVPPKTDTLSPETRIESSVSLGPDPDDALQDRYDAAVRLLADGSYYSAYKEFGKLKNEAHGRLVQDVATNYDRAGHELTAGTKKLIEITKNKTHLIQKRQAWEAVRNFNPDNEDAQQALRSLDRQAEDQDALNTVTQYEKEATRAEKDQDLGKLNELLGGIGILKAQGEKEPAELSPSVYDRVVDVEKTILDFRTRLRDKLGVVSTLMAGGQFREAYRLANEYQNKGIPIVRDASGIFGRIGDVATPEFFKKARGEYLNHLKATASRRLDSANDVRKGDPELALTYLNEAVAILNDDLSDLALRTDLPADELKDLAKVHSDQRSGYRVLTKDDPAELAPTLTMVDQKRHEVQRDLNPYREAHGKVQNSKSPGIEPTTRLQLLREAKDIYSDYSNIDAEISSAEAAVAANVANDIDTALATARGQLAKDDYDGARKTVADARMAASKMLPHPPTNSRLRIVLDGDVRRFEDELNVNERKFNDLMRVLAMVDEALDRYGVENDGEALREAQSLLEKLSSEEVRHPNAIKRISNVSRLQPTAQSWEQGLRDYHLQKWESAETLLQKVADDAASANKAEARKLLGRIRAVKAVDAGVNAETKGELGLALNEYHKSAELFGLHKTDEWTEGTYQRCRAALERLGPVEQVDQEVKTKLGTARMLLDQARTEVSSRRTLDARVKPIPQFKNALDVLSSLQHRMTTLTSEIHRALAEVRDEWRQTYFGAIAMALGSGSLHILQQAQELASELEQNGLIYEQQEQEQLHKLTGVLLQREYDDLLGRMPRPYDAVAENRRKAIARVDRWDTKYGELKRQYSDAVADQIKFHVHSHRYAPEQAKNQIRQEVSKLEYQGDENLTPILIKLCWEFEAWEEAERLADALRKESRAAGRVWSGLTRAAQLLYAGEIEQATAQLAQMKTEFASNANYKTLITENEHDLFSDLKEIQIKQAQRQLQLRTVDGDIRAAVSFARALEIDQKQSMGQTTNRVITEGLHTAGQRLAPGIDQMIKEASTLAIAPRSLSAAIDHASKLHDIISTIQSVEQPLGLTIDQKEGLKHTIEAKLAPKLERWRNVKNRLDDAENKRRDAMGQPATFSRQGSDGGWSFEEPEQKLIDAKQSAGNDRECLELVNKDVDYVDKLKAIAEKLNDQLRAFWQALWDEDFDTVITCCDALEQLWREINRQDAWDGLNSVIRYRHPKYPTDADALTEHKKRANRQKENLIAWQRWVQNVEKKHTELVTSARLIYGHTLDDLQRDKSLGDIVQLCTQIIEQCDALDSHLNVQPGTPPLSLKALAECEKVVVDEWRHDAMDKDGYRDQALSLQTKALVRQSELREPLKRLERVMQAQIEGYLKTKTNRKAVTRPPESNLNLARRELDACMRIDALDPNVSRYRRRLKEFEATD